MNGWSGTEIRIRILVIISLLTVLLRQGSGGGGGGGGGAVDQLHLSKQAVRSVQMPVAVTSHRWVWFLTGEKQEKNNNK